jgi:hypothetical protein
MGVTRLSHPEKYLLIIIVAVVGQYTSKSEINQLFCFQTGISEF